MFIEELVRCERTLRKLNQQIQIC